MPGPARQTEPRLVAQAAEPAGPPPKLPACQSDGSCVQLRQGFPESGPQRRHQGSARVDDGLPGVVAGGLWSLRTPVHPHGLAQRRNLSRRRRTRRRRIRPAAFCTAQQLARQCESRQGPPLGVADQTEVRQPDLMGRPHDPHGQRRPGVDGIQDFRLRRWSRGCVGARRGYFLGPGRQVAGRRTLQR